MAKFKGFTNQQTHQLLSELGYDGPVDKEMMENTDLFHLFSVVAQCRICVLH